MMNTTHSAGFEPVHAVGSLLSGLTVPWWITGGWAIDLATGHVTREHTDVDVMMLERDEHALRGLAGAGIHIQLIADGQPPGPWPAGRRLTAGPAPGPKPPVTGPGRRAGDRLILRGEDLPLPAEVIPASAVGPSGSTGKARASGGARWPASPATGKASRSLLPRWCC